MPLAFTQEDFLVNFNNHVTLLPPAYGVRWEGYVLTRVCLSVHREGGVSQPTQPGGGQVQLGGGVRSSWRGGVRSSRWGGGQVHLAGMGQVQSQGGVSQWGGHYKAGGMPLAFTQEDFLVHFMLPLSVNNKCFLKWLLPLSKLFRHRNFLNINDIESVNVT